MTEQENLQLADWKRKVEQVEVAKRMAEEKARELERRLHMILQSKSWKLTSPLRRIYDFIDAAKQGLTVNRATQYSENGHSTTQGGAAVEKRRQC